MLGANAECVAVKCPDSLGENFKNLSFGVFSKAHTIFFGRVLVVCGERLNSLRTTIGVACSVSIGFHGTAHC